MKKTRGRLPGLGSSPLPPDRFLDLCGREFVVRDEAAQRLAGVEPTRDYPCRDARAGHYWVPEGDLRIHHDRAWLSGKVASVAAREGVQTKGDAPFAAVNSLEVRLQYFSDACLPTG